MKRIVRFGLTGMLTTGVAFVVFASLARAGVHYRVASVASWASGLLIGFIVNRRFTFEIRGEESRRKDFVLYATGAILQLVLGLAGYEVLIGHLRVAIVPAFILNTLMTSIFSFLFLRFVTFRRVGAQLGRQESGLRFRR